MAPISGNNQPVRLRDMRDRALPRDKTELRAPTRRPKFEDSLKHEKAGEVVGEFPSKYNKGQKREKPKGTLEIAAKRQQPRQAVAALMAREGISTSTKFGSVPGRDKAQESKSKEKAAEKRPAWMALAGDKPEDKQELGFEERIKRLREQQKELKSLNQFSSSLEGYSTLDTQLRSNDKRVLQEAGRLDRASFTQIKGSKESANIELMKKEMAMNQALNMQYLQLQDKLQRGLTSLLSNLLKTRSEATKNAISGA